MACYAFGMQTKFKLLAPLLFLILLSPVFTIKSAQATVGGPTFIYDFKYNSSDESVYYIKENFGGRGCPPELIKISLNTEKVDVAYSCDEGEKLVPAGNSYYVAASKINEITKNWKSLTPINLKNNNISIDVNYINDGAKIPGINEVMTRNFSASVYQGDSKIDEFEIVGCSLDQPFVFQGYAIPGFEKKIILLLSAKGVCFEGGYINENLYVVGGVTNLNKEPLNNSLKGPSALIANEGSLTVLESDKVGVTNFEKSNKTPTITLVLGLLLSLLVGVVIGAVFYKVFSRKNTNTN